MISLLPAFYSIFVERARTLGQQLFGGGAFIVCVMIVALGAKFCFVVGWRYWTNAIH